MLSTRFHAMQNEQGFQAIAPRCWFATALPSSLLPLKTGADFYGYPDEGHDPVGVRRPLFPMLKAYRVAGTEDVIFAAQGRIFCRRNALYPIKFHLFL
jgi:hypothetical protein